MGENKDLVFTLRRGIKNNCKVMVINVNKAVVAHAMGAGQVQSRGSGVTGLLSYIELLLLYLLSKNGNWNKC